MSRQLAISVGQVSDKGRKALNQDFHGVWIPNEPLLSSKGIAIALADGISSSTVSQIASETAVTGFLQDYFCTSETWSVKTAAQRVLSATNAWLHAQSLQSPYRYERDRGYICTFSALVLKSNTAHLFHLGDTRIYRLQGKVLEQLTQDHRVQISADQSYLSRALGLGVQLELDYSALPVEQSDIFLLITDGVYEHVTDQFIVSTLHAHQADLTHAAQLMVDAALQHGSQDNLTIQIVRVDQLPVQDLAEMQQQANTLPCPPPLEARSLFDGYQITRQIHASSRSHVYLARDLASNEQMVLKIPSIDLREDSHYLERFALEEWIARRIQSAHVIRAYAPTRQRHFLYLATEYIEGQTLAQWMIDHPAPNLETVRGMIEQIAKGLRAFHRLEMLHQDVRPENIMIDRQGTLKMIDFGATSVAGLLEMHRDDRTQHRLGTAQYSAPEYFLGEAGSVRSDLFSLAVITYQLLSGRLPYGAQAARCKTKADLRKLRYIPLVPDERQIPDWVDATLRKALHPEPSKRYQELSEFIYDLRHPNTNYLQQTRAPLIERDPVVFWKSVSFILLLLVAYLLFRH